MANEVQVNTYSTDFQQRPDIATFADGSYIVVWSSYYSGVGTNIAPVTYVAAQRFNANGTRIGSETVVFAAPETASKNASVTVLRDGAYVVMWTFDDYDSILSLSPRVYAKVYNANGTVRTDAFRVDQTPDDAAGNPQAYATANGGFVVTYSVYDSPYNDVYRRAYDAQGDALGGQTQVNTALDDNNQFFARSETLTNGRILTAWSSVATYDGGPGLFRNEVRGSLMSADGRVIAADFHLTTEYGTDRFAAGGFDIGALRGGGFAVTHKERAAPEQPFGYVLLLERFNAAGTQIGAPVLVRGTNESFRDSEVTLLASGEIVVVWSQTSESTPNIGDDVLARVFSADGRALTGAFNVSVDRNSTDDQTDIRAEALAGGGFIVTYTSDSIDGDAEGIAARTFGRGTSGSDVLSVDQSGTMAGLGGNDVLRGDTRANALAGGAGLDTLTGGAGADHFVFDRPNGVDRITDFTSFDLIVLQARGFGGLALGQLDASVFRLGGGADANDRILYIEATGALYFDANGSEAGGRVQFASLTPGTDLTAADFLII